VQVSCQGEGVTANRFLPADKDRPLGENAAVRSVVQKRRSAWRGQRVLDGLSGAGASDRVGLELKVSNTVVFEICIGLNALLIP
jgi:hypothetical protein